MQTCPEPSEHADSEAELLAAAARRGAVEPGTRAAPSPEYLRQLENEIPFLRRSVRRWHRDQADADDLVQDTLVQALAYAAESLNWERVPKSPQPVDDRESLERLAEALQKIAYDRAFYLFDGNTLDGARLAWKLLSGRDGIERRYWANEGGKWVKKA